MRLNHEIGSERFEHPYFRFKRIFKIRNYLSREEQEFFDGYVQKHIPESAWNKTLTMGRDELDIFDIMQRIAEVKHFPLKYFFQVLYLNYLTPEELRGRISKRIRRHSDKLEEDFSVVVNHLRALTERKLRGPLERFYFRSFYAMSQERLKRLVQDLNQFCAGGSVDFRPDLATRFIILPMSFPSLNLNWEYFENGKTNVTSFQLLYPITELTLRQHGGMGKSWLTWSMLAFAFSFWGLEGLKKDEFYDEMGERLRQRFKEEKRRQQFEHVPTSMWEKEKMIKKAKRGRDNNTNKKSFKFYLPLKFDVRRLRK